MRNTPRTPIEGAYALGQSFWLDYIRRGLIESGELADLIQRGEIRGMTSNPTIFEQAIAASDDYLEALRPLAHAGWPAEKVLDELMVEDVRAAADLFLPLYEETNGGDGFVSIEVNPKLAYETDGTLQEVRRLWSVVNRPNLMVKIPATQPGILAIEEAISEGINVNITLLFSLDRYAEVIDAYLRGLEARHRAGESINHVASVASFFVSRIDTAVDAQLDSIIHQNVPEAERAGALRGKAAVASARLAYAQFEGAFSSPRFEALRQRGARPQRPLWASTSTKNPSYPDTYYVDSLIGADTVNTLPPHTLAAFRDHGTAEPTLRSNLAANRAILDALGALGVSMRDVTQRLEDEGVEKFAASYSALLKQVRTQLLRCQRELGPLLTAFRETLKRFEAGHVAKRLWNEDPSLWTQDRNKAEGIRQRLGWLRLPEISQADLKELAGFASECKAAGFENAVLLGMGGSALAADVMRRMLGSRDGLRLQVLDSTDPAEVLRVSGEAPPSCSLFIVSSKSGTTVEPLALLEYFWQRTKEASSRESGERFVAITDPGTRLESLARERGFRRVFSGQPTVGGRYSALSPFGLVPAVVMGLDIDKVVAGGERMARRCGAGVDAPRNPGLYLGAILGAAYEQGRTKVTFVADRSVEPVADWIEQLMAESTGKDGKGLVPVVGEPAGSARAYGGDRLLVYLRTDGQYDRQVRGWIRGGVPVVILPMSAQEAGLGAEFFRWEVAIAGAAHVMGVNPFDEPDVKRAKDRTTALLEARRRGKEPALPSLLWEGEGIGIRGEDSGLKIQAPESLADMITYLFGGLGSDDAVTLLVYCEPSAPLAAHLAGLRKRIRDRRKATTTLGFGPRYLHSTGQLHKGGPDHSLYLILTMTASADVEVPTMGMTFGALEHAQAMGDLQALLTLGRRAYGLHASSRRDFERLLTAFLSAIR